MPRLRAILWSVVAFCATGLALAVAQDGGNVQAPARRPAGNPARAQAAPPPAGITMDNLLKLWERQSAKLKTLEVSIYRVDKNPAWWDEEEHYLGHAAFRSPQLAYLDFRKVKMHAEVDPKDKNKKRMAPNKKDGQIESTPYQTIICTGAEVWDYHYDVKQIVIFTLDKDAQKRALAEGPLPFLFNMKAMEAKERYEMVLVGQDEKNYLVKIKPLLQQEQERYSCAWIYLNREYLLPTRIVLLAPDKKSSQDFHLSAIKPNIEPDELFFKVVNPGKPWKVERNPGQGGPAAPANARARRRQPEGQAARPALPPNGDQPR
ncbi:MAG: outer membrane lipoprotein-sorting protein [Isosphaerales bacterium]